MTNRNPWDEIAELAQPLFDAPVAEYEGAPCDVLTPERIRAALRIPADHGIRIVGNRLEIEVPLRPAPFGCRLTKVRQTPCPRCGGAGVLALSTLESARETCPVCGGWGTVEASEVKP